MFATGLPQIGDLAQYECLEGFEMLTFNENVKQIGAVRKIDNSFHSTCSEQGIWKSERIFRCLNDTSGITVKHNKIVD